MTASFSRMESDIWYSDSPLQLNGDNSGTSFSADASSVETATDKNITFKDSDRRRESALWCTRLHHKLNPFQIFNCNGGGRVFLATYIYICMCTTTGGESGVKIKAALLCYCDDRSLVCSYATANTHLQYQTAASSCFVFCFFEKHIKL